MFNIKYKEITVIKSSMAVIIFVGVTGVFFAYYSKSLSVFIDSIYTLFGFFTHILALYVVRKMSAPPDNRFHYGYFKLEPISVIIQASLALSIVILALVLAGNRLFFQKEPIEVVYNYAMVYTALSILVCYIMKIITQDASKKLKSRILATDSELWYIDAMLSVAVLAGFLIVSIAQSYGYDLIGLYGDSIITIFVALFLFKKPFQLLREAINDLLDVSAGKQFNIKINQIVQLELEKHQGYTIKTIKTTRAGRKLYVDIKYDLPEIINKAELVKLNKKITSKIEQQLKEDFPYIDIDFYIT